MNVITAHAEGILDGQLIALNALLTVIEVNKYTEAYQIEGAIHNRIEQLKGGNDE